MSSLNKSLNSLTKKLKQFHITTPNKSTPKASAKSSLNALTQALKNTTLSNTLKSKTIKTIQPFLFKSKAVKKSIKKKNVVFERKRKETMRIKEARAAKARNTRKATKQKEAEMAKELILEGRTRAQTKKLKAQK